MLIRTLNAPSPLISFTVFTGRTVDEIRCANGISIVCRLFIWDYSSTVRLAVNNNCCCHAEMPGRRIGCVENNNVPVLTFEKAL